MVRRRRHRSKRSMHKSGFGHMITPASALVSFLQQVNDKDVATNTTFQNLGGLQKAQFIIGNAVGRVTGYYPWPQLTGTHPFGLNPSALINKWVGLGVGGIIYSGVAKEVGKTTGVHLPYTAPIKKAAAGLIVGGLLGGLFDPPARSGGGMGSIAAQVGLSSAVLNKASSVSGFGGTNIG